MMNNNYDVMTCATEGTVYMSQFEVDDQTSPQDTGAGKTGTVPSAGPDLLPWQPETLTILCPGEQLAQRRRVRGCQGTWLSCDHLSQWHDETVGEKRMCAHVIV